MKHVVVGVVSRQNHEGQTEYLLASSTKDFGEFTGAYYPPGGHVEDGEDECEALAREIQEELGVSARVGEKIAETPGDVANQITHWYKVDIGSSNFVIDNSEIANVGWFSQQQITTLKLWPATKHFFDTYVFNQPA